MNLGAAARHPKARASVSRGGFASPRIVPSVSRSLLGAAVSLCETLRAPRGAHRRQAKGRSMGFACIPHRWLGVARVTWRAQSLTHRTCASRDGVAQVRVR
jgi:hypothetical protein